MTTASEKYWYNFATGAVEKGFESPTIDRAGPFDTAEEAARAPELLRERSRAWAEEEAADDAWGTPPAPPTSSDDAADSDGGSGR
ncbi:SPOR domain-containing protein [Microbacterium sp. MC2]